MERGNLWQRDNRRFLHYLLGRGLVRGRLSVRRGGQAVAVLLGSPLRCRQRCGGSFRAPFVLSGLPVFFTLRARQTLAQQFRDILVDRTGVSLLLRDAEFRQQVQNRARFYLELPRQFIDPNFLHTYGQTLRHFLPGFCPQAAPFASASMTARQFSVEPSGGKP